MVKWSIDNLGVWVMHSLMRLITAFHINFDVVTSAAMLQERAELREKSDIGIKQDVEYYKKCMQQAARLKEDKMREKDEKAKKKQLSFKEKEKRKRDAGMQSSGLSPSEHLVCHFVFLLTEPALQPKTMWKRRSGLRENMAVILALTPD